jgi:hypothetical protein
VERSDKREIKPTASRKKPYSRPRLEVYGNLREITQVNLPNGGADSNSHHNKTHA